MVTTANHYNLVEASSNSHTFSYPILPLDLAVSSSILCLRLFQVITSIQVANKNFELISHLPFMFHISNMSPHTPSSSPVS